MELDGDGELGLRDVGVSGLLVELKGASTVAADGQSAEVDVDAIGVDLRAGVADGGHEPPPVGVVSGPGGFDQRRVGDGLGDPQRVRVRGRAFDVQFHNMSDAFAVGNDLTGERGADLGERCGELRMGWTDDDAARSGGQQQHGVVGGGVSIDGDAVEADLNGLAQVGIEDRWLDLGVGENVDQHGGVGNELRVNHAGAFAKAGDADFIAIDVEAGEGGLLDGIGGENGLCDFKEAIEFRTQRCGEGGQGGDELFSRERDADDARGRRKDLLGRAVKEFGDGIARGVGGGQAGGAGGAVGVSGVDGDGADLAAGSAQVFFIDDEGRGSDAVGREGGGGAGVRSS